MIQPGGQAARNHAGREPARREVAECEHYLAGLPPGAATRVSVQAVLSPMATVDPGDTWWQYLALFVLVTASWAGVPFVGGAALGAAGVSASQGRLGLGAVVLVATVAGELGGLIGYAIGNRWGRALVERPGKRQAGRQRMVERGEQLYARWGRLAVFVTPAVVSGTERMKYRQFVLWNLLASLAFASSVAMSCYGVGRLATGHSSERDVTILAVGIAVGIGVFLVSLRRRHRSSASSSRV